LESILGLLKSLKITYSHRERGRDEPERRLRGKSSKSKVQNINITDCISSLKINSD
jgi:hypothetical protein